MRVAELMSRTVVTIAASDSCREALTRMCQNKIVSYP
jgi:CBS-domain-containing membrane protein